VLIKVPHNGAATEYHQDGPYWPHAGARHQLSAWIAIVDVPVERGCMSFIPGTHRRTDIRAVDLHDRTDFFEAAPEVTFLPRVTVPVRAGDCTFHHAYLAHTANPYDGRIDKGCESSAPLSRGFMILIYRAQMIKAVAR